ncbi:MAG: ATP-dependent helicase HrpB [bacterium]
MTPLRPLPIDALLPEILACLGKEQNLVLQASPGSGKTTRVPPSLLDASFLNAEKEIMVLVPRRLAAKMGALRVAEERNEKIGEKVGYQFRFENVTGPKTRLKFLTEGMLLRQMIHSPRLPKTGVVFLDEFHERHLHSDIALSYLRWLQQHHRPDLKIVVMSATLDSEALSAFLGNCPVMRLEAPPHPVEISYLASPSPAPLEKQVQNAVRNALASPYQGDILVFLPGMGDIRKSEETLLQTFGKELRILPLHGELSREAQHLVFKKSDRTKVILSTNVAETSLTIDGVTTVIDSGLHRQASYSWWSGVPSLKTRPISRASALQRAGRAGRTAPGQALRLYTKADFEGRIAFESPEIRRADLTQTLLEMKALMNGPLREFPWFEAPTYSSLQTSLHLLYDLGALREKDLDSPLTEIGQKMAELPLHPRLSRMLLEAEKRSVLPEASRLAALISEDELESLDVWSDLESRRPQENVQKLRSQLLGYFQNSPSPSPQPSPARGEGDKKQKVAFSLLTGFPDRVSKKRPETGGKRPEVDLIFSSGGSGTVPLCGPVSESEFFITLDVQERQSQGQVKGKTHVRSLCPIKPEWLFDLSTSLLQESSELIWEENLKRVSERSRISYGQIVLSESLGAPQDLKTAERIFLKEGLGLALRDASAKADLHAFLRACGRFTEPEAAEEILGRLQIFSQHHPSPEIPSLEGSNLADAIEKWFEGVFRFEALKERPLAERILNTLSEKTRHELSRTLPPFFVFPKGRKARIHYPLGKGPWIASRLQDFFSMKQGPSVMNGKIPLTLHLLAPSQRPVQVTSDLASFWKNAYPQIRKELCRKYPKHAWPEDPLK